ncbi:hypothetical protein XH93_12830 [Bradyrhizobium sp. CCBAU 51753]|nr:hypothetical protein XH93_12830 [Bradyrhizobium sp. CCBAU 51753]
MAKALIFDFDGVVADSEVLANTVLAEIVTELRVPTTVADSYRCYLGNDLAKSSPKSRKRSVEHCLQRSLRNFRRGLWTASGGHSCRLPVCGSSLRNSVTCTVGAEHLLEAVQQRLDANPEAMSQRRETVEHPFGTMKARIGATHFLTKTLPKVATEMALSVLAYNLTRVMNIVEIRPLIVAIVARDSPGSGCQAGHPQGPFLHGQDP